MKTSLLFAIMAGTTLAAFPVQLVLADDTNSLSAPAPASTPAASTPSGSTDDARAQKMEKFKEFIDQLNLTDAQKSQIKQIRANTTDKKERRQQIMAVLTPDQKAKLKEMIQAHRNSAGA